MKVQIRFVTLLLVMLFGLLTIQPANSQILISLLLGDKLNSGKIEFGMEGGFNRSWMNSIDNSKGFTNFHLGFYFDFKLKKDLFINTGVRVKSNVGATKLLVYPLGDADLDSVLADGDVTRKISYFYVPVHLKYRFSRDFYINAGFQVGLRSKAVDMFNNTIYEKNDVVFTTDIRDYVKRLDAGLSGGVGYKFKGTGMNLGLTYYYGLVDVMKDSPTQSKNSALYIYVDIPIGAGYKDEKKAK